MTAESRARPRGLLPLALLVLLLHLGMLTVTGAPRPASPRPLTVRLLPPERGAVQGGATAITASVPAAPAAATQAAGPAESDRQGHPVAAFPEVARLSGQPRSGPIDSPASVPVPAAGSTNEPVAANPGIARPASAGVAPPAALGAPAAAAAPEGDPLRLPSAFVLRFATRRDAAAPPPGPTSAGEAAAELGFESDGHRYRAWLRLAAPGEPARLDTSEGDIGPDGLRPLRYLERRRAAMAAHFDWTDGRIRFSGQQPDAPLPPGAQDRVSALIQLSARLAAPAAAPAPDLGWTVWTATARDAGEQVWRVLALESPADVPADLADGIAPVRLQRVPRHPFEPLLDTWHAPARHGLPVRLRLTMPDGRVLDLHPVGPPHRP